ncbi:MAG: SusD/RagB family nutrient-binding outer membrane lipoprotein [Paludibacter sp.]|nr:SusD/RagB family nutrient-binding outer membrane lipoprotein [Paludibacter sp.]
MKKIKNIMLLSLLAVVFAISSCSDFLNVNTDPNRVTDANVTPDLIFTQAENAVGARQASRFVFLNNWMGYMSRSGTFVVDQMETTYQIDNSFTEANWDQAYNILFDLYQAKTKAVATNNKALAGASIVLSVKLWQETVDQFGDIPYTQAFNYAKYPQPKFDKAVDIYTNLLAQLDTAVVYLNAANPMTSFAKTDIIFGRGDSLNHVISKWNKFANTIRLRILLRQASTTFASTVPTAEIAKITANGGLLGSGEDVSVNPGYTNTVVSGNTTRQNPFYGAFGLTPSGSPATSDNTANNYFANSIEVSAANDPRLTQFYSAPVKGTDYGAQNGSLDGTVVVGTGFGDGLLKTPESDQFILPAFESLFFQAEAVERGWMTGNAQTVYESAVAESFNWLAVPSASTAAATFLSTNIKAMWSNASGVKANELKLIAFQKYIALCCIDPLESWSDLRRGVLVLPTSGSSTYISHNPTVATGLPNVLTYPQSEFTTNGSHIPTPARTTATIFTEKLFWQP